MIKQAIPETAIHARLLSSHAPAGVPQSPEQDMAAPWEESTVSGGGSGLASAVGGPSPDLADATGSSRISGAGLSSHCFVRAPGLQRRWLLAETPRVPA